ncbi:MAG: GNAT family N-acetyltransferase [Aeromicrobium sp.]
MTFTIDELVVPESLASPGGDDFIACIALSNAVEAHVVGTTILSPTPDELLPEYRSNPTRARSHFLARVDGIPVGRAIVTTRPRTPGVGAHVVVDVLPEHRGRGIGAALLARVEAAAAAEGESTLKVSIAHTVDTPGERIAPPTGFGDLPADDPGVRFLRHHGFVLEQVSRISVLDTAGLGDRLPGFLATSRSFAGDDYAVRSWVGPTPSARLDDLAVLRTRMSTDAPMAGLQAPPDLWDAARIEAHDARIGEGGQTVLTTAAEHLPTGRLVGFSEIFVPDGRTSAMQQDTLVLREHRGRRLGLLLKASTARDLLREAPHVDTVITYNAEENRPMLDVNEAMGFRPIGYEGGWQRRS